MRPGPTRLLLAALVAGATGVATAADAGAAVEVAGAASAIGLIRPTACGNNRAPCVQLVRLGCNVRSELAAMGCIPMAVLVAPPRLPPPPSQIIVSVEEVAPVAPPTSAILPFAPKTSPPVG